MRLQTVGAGSMLAPSPCRASDLLTLVSHLLTELFSYLLKKGFHNDHMLVILFFGTLSVVGSLKTFGTSKLIFWRESAAGVNPLSFFVAKVRPCGFGGRVRSVYAPH
jgi:hypothetical protein